MKKKSGFDNRKKVNRNCQLRKVWIWPTVVEDYVKSNVQGYSLNCPSGASKIGDVLGDLEPISSDVRKMDMTQLPFEDNTFDTVISDPPWKINFFHRQRPFFESVRVCKVGGRIIYNAYWIPISKYVHLEECVIRQDSRWCNVSVICIFKKVKDVTEKKWKEVGRFSIDCGKDTEEQQ